MKSVVCRVEGPFPDEYFYVRKRSFKIFDISSFLDKRVPFPFHSLFKHFFFFFVSSFTATKNGLSFTLDDDDTLVVVVHSPRCRFPGECRCSVLGSSKALGIPTIILTVPLQF
jgi:hypothetical protein